MFIPGVTSKELEGKQSSCFDQVMSIYLWDHFFQDISLLSHIVGVSIQSSHHPGTQIFVVHASLRGSNPEEALCLFEFTVGGKVGFGKAAGLGPTQKSTEIHWERLWPGRSLHWCPGQETVEGKSTTSFQWVGGLTFLKHISFDFTSSIFRMPWNEFWGVLGCCPIG